MNTSTIIEIAGYVGSTLVVVSMLMSSVVKLRVINTIGSVISATYALIIHSYPLALMNICLIIINVYNLMKLLKTKQQYDLISVSTDDGFLAWFMAHYQQDIRNFFQNAETALSEEDTAYLVCCDTALAGLLLGNVTEKGVLEISVDYSTPTYRDCSVGKYLYSRLPEQGISKLVYSGKSEKHEEYLRKMGFAEKNGVYEKFLAQ